jgi:hypothetical protein
VLLVALLEGFQDDLAAVVEAEFAARDDLASRLLGLWRNVSDHPVGAPWFLLEIELWLRAARDPDLAGPLRRAVPDQVHDLMRDEFGAWVDEFDLSPAHPRRRLPQAVMATLLGLQMQRNSTPRSSPTTSP